MLLSVHQKEQLEKQKIELKRQREQERVKRVLNDKMRTMGVDVNSLEQQIAEKEQIKQFEKQQDELLDTFMAESAKCASHTAKLLQLEKHNQLKEMRQFRATKQSKDQAREFDLNDPNAKLKDKPARLDDDDERCGVSSMQKFIGEDLKKQDRIKAQQEQMKQWIAQQSMDKQQLQTSIKKDEKDYAKQVLELNKMAQDLEKKRHLLKQDNAKLLSNFNEQLAMIKKDNEALYKLQQEEASLQEVQNMLNSDFLNETFDTTVNVNDATRFKKYHFKHLRPEQYAIIMQMREQQIEEKKLAAQTIQIEQEREHLEQMIVLRKAKEMEREQARLSKMKHVDLQLTHKEQAQQQKEKTAIMNKVYENRVTNDFFTQFGQSSR